MLCKSLAPAESRSMLTFGYKIACTRTAATPSCKRMVNQTECSGSAILEKLFIFTLKCNSCKRFIGQWKLISHETEPTKKMVWKHQDSRHY